MADLPDLPDLPDLTQPWPDLGHEAIRQEVMAHLEALSDAFLVGQTTAEALQLALTHMLAAQQALTDQAAVIADLQTRVTALEQDDDEDDDTT